MSLEREEDTAFRLGKFHRDQLAEGIPQVPNGSLVRETSQNALNSGLGISVLYLDLEMLDFRIPLEMDYFADT